MSAPNVIVNQTNGNLGRSSASKDGIALLIATGVAVTDEFALNDLLGPFKSIEDAEAKGIDADYDVTNSCQVWRHIHDFYSEAGRGHELHVMVVADTVLMKDMVDKTNLTTGVKKALIALKGEVRLVGVSRVPDGAYTPTFATELEQDVLDAIDNAKELVDAEFTAFRPIQVLIEGRNWQGDVAATLDLRDPDDGPNANRVSVIIGQDLDVADDTDNEQAGYACVGKLLGRAARIQVQRNVARAKDGALTEMVNGGFSNNEAINTLDDTDVDTLNDKGYIFIRSYTGKAGLFFNDDHTACPIDDDYAFISRGRPADKATRIARTVYLDEMLDDIQIDPDSGKMDASTCKHYESIIEDAIGTQMVSQGELSGVNAFVDADQNVLQDDEVDVQLNIVPKGTARRIVVDQSYALKL